MSFIGHNRPKWTKAKSVAFGRDGTSMIDPGTKSLIEPSSKSLIGGLHNNNGGSGKARSLLDVECPRLFRRRRNVSDTVVIASLRRRLWQAFTENDAATALKCWSASRKTWEDWESYSYNDDEESAILPKIMDPTSYFLTTDRLSVAAKYSEERPRSGRRNIFRKARAVANEDSLVFLTTPLHQAARLGDLSVFEEMARVAQDWNVRDGQGRTILHCALAAADLEPPPRTTVKRRAAAALQDVLGDDDEDRKTILLLSLDNGASLYAADATGRTALHYAALRGMDGMCSKLLATSYDMLTLVDTGGRTPCELAASNGHSRLAAHLEARALLIQDSLGMEEYSTWVGAMPPFTWFQTDNAVSERSRAIRECFINVKQIVSVAMARDITVSEIEGDDETMSPKPPRRGLERMVGMHSSHMERLLLHYNMSAKEVSDAMLDDPFHALESAGITFPPHATEADTSSEVCLICCEDNVSLKTIEGCSHAFCRDCWKEYLGECATTQSTGALVSCPHHDCQALLSPTELEDLAGNSTYEQLVATGADLFVTNHPNYRFCPHPGCGKPVQFIDRIAASDRLCVMQLLGAVCSLENNENCETLTYEGVPYSAYHDLTGRPIPRAHRFCFGCDSTTIHWPIRCDKLEEWKKTVVEYIGDNEDETPHADVAQRLWLKANTRPCPKVCDFLLCFVLALTPSFQCQAAIQKSEGCNHMTCCNPSCKHEFCWICRKDWKLHNTETGGFFLCNRWADEKDHVFYEETDAPPVPAAAPSREDPLVLEVTYGTAMHESRNARQRAAKMDRFLHHYQRWNAHSDSASLEAHMMDTVHTRLAPVVKEATLLAETDLIFDGHGLSFIYSAFTELLECRSMLKHSYAFGFLRYAEKRRRREKASFERLQAELELLTEQLSDVVARAHLRATMMQIIYLTKCAGQKRLEYTNFMFGVLKEEKEQEDKPDPLPDIFLGHGEGSATAQGERVLRDSLRTMLRRNGLDSIFHDDFDDDGYGDLSDWACSACTYVNISGGVCRMCSTPRTG